MDRIQRRRRIAALVVIGVVGIALVAAAIQRAASDSDEPSDARVASAPTSSAVLPGPLVPPATVPAEDGVEVVIVQDSFAAGSPAGGLGPANWVTVLRTELRSSGYLFTPRVRTLGASGYAVRGAAGQVFADAINELVSPGTQIVLIFGGVNDASAAGRLGEAPEETYAAVRRAAPDATLIVVGPAVVGTDVPQGVRDVHERIRDAAGRAGATFIDPLAEDWFAGSDRELIGSDGKRPSDAGHALIAQNLAPALRSAIDDAGR